VTGKLQALARLESLSERVYAALRENLRTGRIRRGVPLQEAALAAQLGVSRTPVREALARLASEGLVTADGRKFAGPELSAADIEEIYALRFLLEAEAMRLIATASPGRAKLAPLRKALEDMGWAQEAGDGKAFMDANLRFRSAWMELVPNRRLAHVISLYADHARHLRVSTLHDAAVRSGVAKRLKRLLAALGAGNADAAAKVMREHLEEARRILLSKPADKAADQAHGEGTA
jgi:DNA-binding GntR family transcriptional regulator